MGLTALLDDELMLMLWGVTAMLRYIVDKLEP